MAKTELEEAGLETEGMVDSTAKLREEILALSGVDIMENANEFKSTYKIMDELSAKWEDLSDIQQATVTELIAGKRQGNIVSSLMQNFETARDALETSLNSSGSAMKEHEKWQKSLEAQILKLKASWQSLSQAFLSSDFLKVALNGVIGLVDGLTKLIDTFGALPTLMTTIATGFSLFKNGGFFKTFNSDLDTFTSKIGIANKSFAELGKAFKSGGIKGVFDAFKSPLSETDLAAIDKYNELIKSGVNGHDAYAQSMQDASAAAQTLVKGANGATVAIGKQTTATLASKVAMLGAKVAAVAFNAALTMGISLLIDWAISGIQKLINAKEDLAEKVEELTSKFKEQHEELQKIKGDYDTDNESSMISRYEKLSKGVGDYGENLSLTADEYSEYQSIVDKVANQFPTLINGYSDTGVALLSCKDNVEQLVAAYKDLVHYQNLKIFDEVKDIEDNYTNLSNELDYDFWEGVRENIPIVNWFTSDDLNSDTVKQLEKLLNGEIDVDDAFDLRQLDEVKKAFEDAGIDTNWWGFGNEDIEKALINNRKDLENIVDTFYAQFDNVIEQKKTIAMATLSEAFEVSDAFDGMNKNLKSLAYQTINNLDKDFFDSLVENGTSVKDWTEDMLNQLKALSSDDSKVIEAGFELRTKFNGGDISYGQYIDQLQETVGLVDELELPDEVKNQIKLSLNSEDVLADYKALVNDLKNIGLDDAVINNFLDGLSAEEYSAAMKIVPNLDTGTTLKEIQALIDEQLATEFAFDIKVQTEGIDALNTALAESRSAVGLTSESIKALKARYEDLDGFNAAALFEKTANGIHLNNEELSRLEEQYVATNKLEIDKNLNTLAEKYQDVANELKNNTRLTADERKELEASKESLADKIEELSTLASQYDGLTSAFAKWQNAQNSPEEGDNYDSLYENLEGIKELYDKGLVGTDKFKTAVQLMTSEDLSNADIDDVVSAYKEGYPKMQRYFTEGQKGCKNFLNDVRSLNSEWAHMNKDGSWEINFNAEEVSKELGVSVDFVLQIVKKLKDYGFEVNLEDSSVDNLKTKIEQTEAKLKELGQSPVDINVDIDASSANLGKIESEIEKAKSKIAEINNSSVSPEVKTAQLEDARAKLETLIQKKQEVSQPAFMNLNTSQVNASLVDALEKIQDYQTALNELNKLNELKESGIVIDDSEIDAAEEKLDAFAKAIQGLDGDVKVAIGLEEDGSIDSIHKAFEEGKVKIDADTDPAVTKIEQLAENVDKIEDKDVTINVTVNGLDDVKELNKQINLATNIDGDIDKLSKYVENAKTLKDLGENITSYVTAEVKGNVVNTFEYKLDNLKVFTDSAKDIEKIGFVKSEVSADIKGNVIDEFEYKIDNLKVYSDSAKNVSQIGNVKSTVTANVRGNVTDEFEYKINNLKVFSESAKDIYKIGNVESNVKATINSGEDGDVIDEFEYKLDNLKLFAEYAKELQGISDVDISIKAVVNTGDDGDVVDEFEYKLDNLSEFADHVKELQGLKSIDISVNAVVNTGNDGDVVDEFEYKLDNLSKFADYVKELQGLESVDVSVNATVNTGDNGDAVDTFEYKLNNLEAFAEGAKALQGVGNVSSEITAKVNTGESGDAVDTFEYKLNNLEKFAQYAKELQGVGSVDVSVSAKVNTGEDEDVTETFEYKLNNLDEFATYAKELQGLEDVDISIKANVDDGDESATNEWEYKLNNLSEFATYAKGLQGLESVDITITANTKGNVVGEKTEGKINNLEVFAKGAKGLDGLESKEITITANAKGNVVGKKTESKINNLEVFAVGAKKVQGLSNKDITITANAKGNVVGKKTESKINNLEVFAKGAKSLQGISSKEVDITANADGNVVGDKTEGKINNLKVFGDSAKALNGVESKKVSITADANGNVVSGDGASSRLSSLTEFKSLISGMSNQTVTVSVTANVDSANINQAITLLTNVANSGVFKDYKATVQVGAKIATIDDATVKNYKAPPKEGKVKYSVDSESSVYTWTAPSKDGVVNYSASVEALTDAQKHKTGTITYKAKISGFPVVNGTANVNGSAFANGTSGKAFKQGDWGVKKTVTALTGELGQELVVYGNRFWTVGDHGAEFATIPKGAIVFNHKQTEELFKNGKVTSDGGRGRAFANGTAFISGTGTFFGSNHKPLGEVVIKDGGSGTVKKSNNVSTNKKSSNNTNATGSFVEEKDSPSQDKFEETFDWIDTLLSRLERTIDNLDKTVDNSAKSWKKRNNALTKEINAVNESIAANNSAKKEYKKASKDVGLNKYAKSKNDNINYELLVREGKIDLSTIDDETLADKIKEYQKYYELYLDCIDKANELSDTEAELQAQRFDFVKTQYEDILQGFDHTESMLDEYISQAEAQGHIVSKQYYQALSNNEEQKIAKLQEERNALIKTRNELVQSGDVAYGSEKWYEMSAEIDAVTQAIEAGKTALIEYDNAMREIDWQVFDLIQERISDVTAEANFLIDLMSNDKLHDDKGKLTSQGLATMGLHGQNYNTYMYQADTYASEIAKLDKQIAKDPYDQELINRRRELIELQRESILAAEDEKQAIKDLVEEGIEKELDSLQELIDKHNEELDGVKDLYEYNKRVKEQTKEIASLQKQLSAYSSDDSEEARKKVQELKISLEEAEADLEETEYDRYISDQQKLLDSLYDEYETILNQRLDNIDALMADMIGEINANASNIRDTLSAEAANVGATLSDEMWNIWNVGADSAKSVLTMYGDDFIKKSTAINTTLGGIQSTINSMLTALNQIANTKITNGDTNSSSGDEEPKVPSVVQGAVKGANAAINVKSGGDGKPNIGDKVTFLNGKYYYDAEGKNPAGSQNRGKKVYITNINRNSYATHPYHISTGKKLGSGDLGWLKLSQLSGYAIGKKNFLDNEVAWTQENGREFIVRPSDGAILTPIAKGDSVLTSAASNNIWDMANSPAEFIKDNLKFNATNVPNNSNTQSNYTQNLDKVVFNLPNVKNYEQLLSEMQKDKNFERLILSMSIDRLAGKSGLAKNKSIR